MDGQTEEWMDFHQDRWTDGQTERHLDGKRQTDKWTNKQINGWAGRKDGQTEIMMLKDRQMDIGWMDGRTDRQMR
jgi:hypothetical protein